MPQLVLGDTRVNYMDTGGNGAPVLFSHGILMDHEMFEPQVEALRDEFRCISWDQRGHGATTTDGSWSYWDSASDALGILDHLDIEHAFFAGMSQGGFLSLRAALTAPERVDGLALIDTQAGPEDPAEDLDERLHEIACPALVIHSEADPAIGMDKAEALCEGLARCEGLIRIPAGGHAANLSHPGVVNEALRDFFRRHAG